MPPQEENAHMNARTNVGKRVCVCARVLPASRRNRARQRGPRGRCAQGAARCSVAWRCPSPAMRCRAVTPILLPSLYHYTRDVPAGAGGGCHNHVCPVLSLFTIPHRNFAEVNAVQPCPVSCSKLGRTGRKYHLRRLIECYRSRAEVDDTEQEGP